MSERFNPRILILVLAGLALLTFAGLLAGSASGPTATAAYTSLTLDQYSSTVVSQNGLGLTLSLSSMNYHPGAQISITINEKNTLARENNVRVADRWPIQGLSLNPCGTGVYPFGMLVLKGYYDAASLVDITPLKIFDPNQILSCVVPGGFVSYDFEPWSGMAAICTTMSAYENTKPAPTDMTTSLTLPGFWVGGCCNATFSSFTPGIYTIVGGDEWGALVILHFTISPSS
jgi:hypothetical protein